MIKKKQFLSSMLIISFLTLNFAPLGQVYAVEKSVGEEKAVEQVLDVKEKQVLSPGNSVVGGVVDFNQVEKIPIKNLNKLKKINSKQIPVKLKSFKVEKKEIDGKKIDYKILDRSNWKDNVLKIIQKVQNLKIKVSQAVLNFVAIPAYADDLTPIMDYYDGIEENPVDSALYYLSNNQNEDGSFGDYNNFIITSQVVDRLLRYRLTDNDQFDLALQYLQNYEPQNNQERAIKIRLLNAQGQNYDQYLQKILESRNSDYGYGLNEDNLSDILSTIEVFDTYTSIGYDQDEVATRALLFLILQIPDDGKLYYTSGSYPSYYLVNRTISTLKPFENLTITADGGLEISIADKINDMLVYLNQSYDENSQSLVGSQEVIDYSMLLNSFKLYNFEENKWGGLEEYIKNNQNIDGSFGYDESSLVGSISMLEKTDIEVQTVQAQGDLINGVEANLNLLVKNNGYKSAQNIVLHIFVDDYKLMEMDLSAQGLELDPQDTANLDIEFPNTDLFIGDSKFTFYVEDSNERDFEDNWLEENFVFNPNQNSLAALPVYYTAHQFEYTRPEDGVIVPAMFFNVPVKNDPNRIGYVAGMREVGGSWSFYYLDPVNGNIFINLPEDVVLEVTIGVLSDVDGQTFITNIFDDYSTIHLSSNPFIYVGSVSGQITKNNQGLPNFLLNDGQTTTDEYGNFSIPFVRNGSGVYSVLDSEYQPFLTKVDVESGVTTENVRVFTRLKQDAEVPIADSIVIAELNNNQLTNGGEANITVSGSDNIGIKEADFYYWDPDEEFWFYIGTGASQDKQSVDFNWYISQSLEGDNFRLRAILWDYQNNYSDPIELGPFSIINTRPPDDVSGLYADNNETGSLLNWTEYMDDGDFSYFNIYRTEDENLSLNDLESIDQIADLNINSYQDNGIVAGNEYYYAISTVGINGVESGGTSWIGPVVYIENNLLLDGGMALNDLWQNWGIPSTNQKQVDSEIHSQVTNIVADIDTKAGIQQTINTVLSGHTYELKMKVKVLSGQVYTKLNIKNNPNYSKHADFAGVLDYLTTENFSDLTEYSRIFTLPADYDNLENVFRLSFIADGTIGGDAEILVDDMSIVEIEPSNNLLTDGDMESIMLWQNWGNPAINEKITDNELNSQVTHLSAEIDTKAGIQQTLPNVSSNQAVLIKMRVKVNSGRLNPRLTIVGNPNYSKQADLENKQINLTSENYSDWAWYERVIVLPVDYDSNSNLLRLKLLVDSTGELADILVDDVSVELIEPSLNLIQDGAMESNTADDWLDYGNPVKEKVMDNDFDTQVLRAVTQSVTDPQTEQTVKTRAGIQQNISSMEAGATYELSFDLQIPAGLIYPKLIIKGSQNYHKNHDFEDNGIRLYSSQYPDLAVNTYKRRFTLPADFDPINNNLYLRFVLENAEVEGVWIDGEFNMDNVSIMKVEDVDNPIFDANMEALSVNTWDNYKDLAVREKDSEITNSQVMHLKTTDIPNATNWGGIQQYRIDSLVPGQSYKFSFNYYLPIGKLYPRLGIADSNTDFEFSAFGTAPTLLANQDFGLYERIFTVPNDFTEDFRVVMVLASTVELDENEEIVYGEYGEVYFDNVKIEIAE